MAGWPDAREGGAEWRLALGAELEGLVERLI